MMTGMVDLELVYLIRNFLYQRGDQGATVNDLLREVDMNFSTVYDALIYMRDCNEVRYKQKSGYVVWYLKNAD
jgi:DNA-binding IclR family transcriptional regulator